MKKVILLTVTVFLFVASISAQSKKHEIDLGVGVLSTNQLVGTLSSVIVSSLPGVKMENHRYIGAIHLGYKYALMDRFALGPTFTYDRGTSDATLLRIHIGKFTSRYYSLALEGDFKYVNSDKFKLYSLMGVGATLLDQTYKNNRSDEIRSRNKTFFNFQVTPIGIKYGDELGIFTELGFGYKGILCAGLFCRF